MMLRKKVDLISECCGAKVEVKGVGVRGSANAHYHYCTKCRMPCELDGYAVAEQEDSSDRIAIENQSRH